MKIEVLPYNPDWPAAFEREKRILEKAIGDPIEKIHHIGSTAVECLAAKPIIDILLETRSLEELDRATGSFEEIGYEAKGEFGIKGRRYYRKGGVERTHQIHAFKTGDPNLVRHIALRDYLRFYPDIRKEYQELKLKVAATCENDIDRYCDGKNEFISFHERAALKWIPSSPTTIK